MLTFPLGAPDGSVLTKEELDAAAAPSLLNQLEAIPQPLYDTNTLATGNTGPFNFFTVTRSDESISNLASPGQLAADQYYILQYVHVTWLQIPFAGTDAAINPNLKDWANFYITNAPRISLFVSQKEYGPWPILMAGAEGGMTGVAFAEGATAAGHSEAAVSTGIPGQQGLYFGGAVVLTPRRQFKFVITLKNGAALTLTNNVDVRVTMMGTLYRNVQ